MSKPLTVVIKEAWDKLVAIITSDKKEDDSNTVKPVEPNEGTNDNDDNSDSKPMEPEINSGVAGF